MTSVRLSLSWKLTFLLVVFACFLTLIYFALSLVNAVQTMNHDFSRHVEVNARFAARLLRTGLPQAVKRWDLESRHQIEAAVTPLLRELQRELDLENIFLFTRLEENVVIHSSAKPLPFPSDLEPLLQEAFAGRLVTDENLVGQRERGRFAFAPVTEGVGKAGPRHVVAVQADLTALTRRVQLLLAQHMGFLFISVVLALLVGLLLARTITTPVRILRDGLQRVMKGDLRHTLPSRPLLGLPIQDELSQVIDAFNLMSRTLSEKNEENRALYDEINAFNKELARRVESATAELKAANERLREKQRQNERELALAQRIQTALLPAGCVLGPLRFSCLCRPAHDVGGDFYSFFPLSQEEVALVVGDVSGRGIPAALLMSMLYGVFLELPRQFRQPAEILKRANLALRDHGGQDFAPFATCFFGIFDFAQPALRYARAGHTLPLLVRGGKVQPLAGEGILLGAVDDPEFEEETLALEAGDKLVFYTDGLTEAVAPGGERYGTDRLLRCVQEHHFLAGEPLLDTILQSVLDFQRSLPQDDDLALVVAEVAGPAADRAGGAA